MQDHKLTIYNEWISILEKATALTLGAVAIAYPALEERSTQTMAAILSSALERTGTGLTQLGSEAIRIASQNTNQGATWVAGFLTAGLTLAVVTFVVFLFKLGYLSSLRHKKQCLTERIIEAIRSK